MSTGGVFPPKNDRLAYFPVSPQRGYLMVGHEIRHGTTSPLPLDGRYSRLTLEQKQVDPEGALLICEDQRKEHIQCFGPNQILKYRADQPLQEFLQVHPSGEPSGPFFSPDEQTLFLSFLAGNQSAVLTITQTPSGHKETDKSNRP